MHCIRVELHLADGYYELHPVLEDDGVAELLPPEAEAAPEVEQFPSFSLEGKPRMHETPMFSKLMHAFCILFVHLRIGVVCNPRGMT